MRKQSVGEDSGRPWLVWRAVEGLLWTTAAVCGLGLGCVLVVHAAAARATSPLNAVGKVAGGMAAASSRWDGAMANAVVARASEGQVTGRLEIPSLSMQVPIVAGIEPMSLTQGVGHIGGTAVPGGLGTVGLAGHRDTYLRVLRNVRVGADVVLVDGTGRYHYTVRRTEVVSPEEVRVLDVQATPQLALITCFPFDYVGAAPQRFVVHAELRSVLPE